MVLTASPTADVTIGLSSSDASEGTVSPASLTFTSGNWNVPKTVTVTGVDDGATDGPILYTISTARATSADTRYSGLDASNVVVVNGDNDSPQGGAGSLDPTFGGVGVTVTDFGNGSPTEAFEDVVVLPDGKILAGGYSGGQFLVARYTAAGALDTTFGTGGYARFDVNAGAAGADGIHGLAVQSDGKIIAAGQADVPGGPRLALARLNPNGTVDTTFGTQGFMVTSTVANAAQTVKIQADDKIVTCGGPGFLVERFNANGTPDSGFGSNGVFDAAWQNSVCLSVALTADDKILAAGTSGSGDFGIVRLDSNGTLDSSFDGDGRVVTDVGGPGDVAQQVLALPGGKVVVAGIAGPAPSNFGVVWLNENGSPDGSIAGGGRVTHDFLGAHDIGEAAAVDADGRIVVIGETNGGPGSGNHFLIVRYLPTGALDTTFGGGTGRVFTGLSDATGVPLADVNNVPLAGAIQPDRAIVVAGYVSGSRDGIVARYIGEGAGITVTPTTGLTTTEAGGTATFTVVLDTVPSADVVIGVSSSDTTEGTISSSSLTFTGQLGRAPDGHRHGGERRDRRWERDVHHRHRRRDLLGWGVQRPECCRRLGHQHRRHGRLWHHRDPDQRPGHDRGRWHRDLHGGAEQRANGRRFDHVLVVSY